MRVVVFEDELVSRLFPITIGRAAYAITCGSFRLIDWLRELGGPVRGLVRPHLVEIQRTDFSDLVAAPSPPSDRQPTLYVNARIVPSRATFRTLQRLASEVRSGIVHTGNEVAAVLFPAEAPPPPTHLAADKLTDFFDYAGAASLPPVEAELPLFEYPHDVIRYNMQTLAESLEHRLSRGGYQEIAEGVFTADGATLGKYAVTNSRNGPILLDEGATVGPFCYLSGPAYLGRGARINEHSSIKDAVSIGHTTKIGGEVEASVIEPFTNKQHHGFLGHSYLGSWINLGAGTCNSDLKNTYGSVKMVYRGEDVMTGMQFLGCIMGDYAKTAINTGIFTGKTIGACSMVYGFVTTNVPSFVNYARLFGQVTELPAEVMVATQQRMFVRRKVSQRPCDAQLLHDMYELTRHERQLAGEPLSL